MTVQKTGLVDQLETVLRTFRDNAPIGEPDFRALAVEIVRLFRNYIEAEIRMPDPYDQPSKGPGLE